MDRYIFMEQSFLALTNEHILGQSLCRNQDSVNSN